MNNQEDMTTGKRNDHRRYSSDYRAQNRRSDQDRFDSRQAGQKYAPHSVLAQPMMRGQGSRRAHEQGDNENGGKLREGTPDYAVKERSPEWEKKKRTVPPSHPGESNTPVSGERGEGHPAGSLTSVLKQPPKGWETRRLPSTQHDGKQLQAHSIGVRMEIQLRREEEQERKHLVFRGGHRIEDETHNQVRDMSSKSSRRKLLTLQQKCQALKKLDRGSLPSEVMSNFGISSGFVKKLKSQGVALLEEAKQNSISLK